MDKKYTGIVIGCGRVGATFEMESALPKPASHAAALQANPHTELVALVDPNEGQLKKATEYYRVPGYTDPRACLVELKPDIVVIATPPDTHESLLGLAIELQTRAVICEKPVSNNLESAQRMVESSKNSDTIVVLNHQRRFFPQFRALRERINAGGLGRIQQVTCYYTNGLNNNGTHTIDALQHVLTDHVVWVRGVENKQNPTAVGGPNIDGMIGFSSGAVAMLQSLDNDSYIVHDFALYGTKGAAFIRQYGYRFEEVPVTLSGIKELDWHNAITTIERRSMMEGTVAHVVECLGDGVSPQSTLQDGYHVMQVLDALSRSARNGGQLVIVE